MKPSEKAIESAREYLEGIRTIQLMNSVSKVLAAAYAIDVDPLLAEKDREIEQLNGTAEKWLILFKQQTEAANRFDELWHESERQAHQLKQRISALEAEIERLTALHNKCHEDYVQLSNEASKLEAENAKLREALICAEETIGTWHGSIGWELYQNSPEMKKIYGALRSER